VRVSRDKKLTAVFHLYGKEDIPMRAKLEQMKKKGQGLVEYALILVLIAIVVILILTFLGSQVNETFSQIGSGLDR
jgi:pilus assembly protein Flp/PilA